MAGARLGSAMRQIGRLFDEGTATGLADSQLLERFVNRGDGTAFAVLVERHGPMVLGVCRAVIRNSAEVEDAFQATFLVLIRKADAIRGHDALGGWLHRVAYRIAVRSRIEGCRRETYEHALGDSIDSVADPTPAVNDDDRSAALHEEVARLPEKYRRAIVLCCLEGLTHAQAAQALGRGEATIRRRLSNARELLRSRLIRRGFGLSPVLLVEALAKESSAAVPRIWINGLAKGAVAMPSGRLTASGTISAAAAKLAQATLATLFAESVKSVTLVGFTLIGLALIGMHTIPSGLAQAGNGDAMKEEPARSKPVVASITPKIEDRTKPVTFAGIVLDPDGKPFADAKIYVPTYGLKGGLVNPPIRAASGADGRFRFDVPIDEFDRTFHAEPWRQSPVVARAEGYAFGLANLTKEGEDLTLRLTRDDIPIEGRVIDIQGKPVPEVSIQVLSIHATEDENLSNWLGAVFKNKDLLANEVYKNLTRRLDTQPDPPLVPPVRTDADGRFRITGIGRERLVELTIEGPTIEAVRVQARTTPGETLQVPVDGSKDTSNRNIIFGSSFVTSRRITVYGSSFVHVAGPTRPIEGIVRDQATGVPLADITVLPHAANPLASTWARTDARGQYRLVGLPRGREGDIVAVSPADLPVHGSKRAEMGYPPEESLPYLQARITVPKEDIKDAISLDIGLRRGVLVTGCVLDKSTGKPVAAQLRYYVFTDNPFRKQPPGHRLADWFQVHFTPRDGTYRLIVFPGPGLLTAKADRIGADEDRYAHGAGLAQSKRLDKRGFLLCQPSIVLPSNFHTLNEIEPTEDTRSLSKDILLDPGRNLSLDVLGPDGKALVGTTVSGLSSRGRGYQGFSLDATRYTVLGLLAGKPRTITALHKGKNLVGDLVVKGDEVEPLKMRLEPWGEVIGRVVDDQGRPETDTALLIDAESNLESARVGKDGRFRVKGLIPGRKYNYLYLDERRSTITGDIFRDLSVKPGEVKDLGDIAVKPSKSP